MGNRSGKRLTPSQRLARKRQRRKEKKKPYRKPQATYYHIPPQYKSIHIAISQYIRDYLKAYNPSVRNYRLIERSSIYSVIIFHPVEGYTRILDVHKISFSDDIVKVDVRYHTHDPKRTNSMAYHTASTRHFSEILSDPNLFDKLRVFLDCCAAWHWGCNMWGSISPDILQESCTYLAGHGFSTQKVLSEQEVDIPCRYEVFKAEDKIGILQARSGQLQFLTPDSQILMSRLANNVVGGYAYKFALDLANTITSHDSCSSDNQFD